MSFIFGGGKKAEPPPVPVPEPPPTIEDAAMKERETSDVASRRRGLAANILSGKQGTEAPTVGTKVLLGG